MYRYKSIRNRRNINIDMYICEAGRVRYLMAIPDNMHDKTEMFVESFNSGGKQGNDYNDNIREAMSQNGNTIESVLLDAIIDFPVIMPIIPDIVGLPDFQQLSLEAVRDYKIHEDFLKCIEDAK